jgi:hypothetical protein
MVKNRGGDKTKWREIVNGYGLQRIDDILLKREVCCRFCEMPLSRDILYTDMSLQTDGTRHGYDRLIDSLQNRVYCRYHAMWWFGD